MNDLLTYAEANSLLQFVRLRYPHLYSERLSARLINPHLSAIRIGDRYCTTLAEVTATFVLIDGFRDRTPTPAWLYKG